VENGLDSDRHIPMSLVYSHFGIDEEKFKQEQAAMLKDIRRADEKEES
jgi:hypothetical protein